MAQDPVTWRNRSPGDLAVELPEAHTGDVALTVEASRRAFAAWSATPLQERWTRLQACRERLVARSDDLSALIATETGKPIREARLELGAVIAKFDLAFADAEKFLRDEPVVDGPHPAAIRRRARGPAAVIAPFNFPIHLGHGAAVAYLLAGNPVLFKPSPLAVNVGLAYAAEMAAELPDGVFLPVPGWGETGRALALHPAVRSVCFTGSVPAGTALARDLAADYSKALALELGGKNSVLVFADADLAAAARAVADGACLTSGQRCNATSRVLVDESVAAEFLALLLDSLARYVPGDPMDPATLLGPLVSGAAADRYTSLTGLDASQWVLPGERTGSISCGKRGHYVRPAVVVAGPEIDETPLATQESFVPIIVVERVSGEAAAVARHEAWRFGLTASVFTSDEARFRRVGDQLSVGNLYWNLPTTFSPSTLPFGGWGASGNGRPGGRGFVRFAAEDQAVQWKAP